MRPTETEDKGILFMMNWSKSPSEIKSFCGQPGSAELIYNLDQMIFQMSFQQLPFHFPSTMGTFEEYVCYGKINCYS